jgi:hypothetical protein
VYAGHQRKVSNVLVDRRATPGGSRLLGYGADAFGIATDEHDLDPVSREI